MDSPYHVARHTFPVFLGREDRRKRQYRREGNHFDHDIDAIPHEPESLQQYHQLLRGPYPQIQHSGYEFEHFGSPSAYLWIQYDLEQHSNCLYDNLYSYGIAHSVCL